MKTLGIGLGLLGIGMIICGVADILKVIERQSNSIPVSGEPGDYSFEDEWEKDIESE